MFEGSCAWEKVDRLYDWINSVGRTAPGATTAAAHTDALPAGERKFVHGEESL
jgi:hypothetical protein